MDQLKEALYLLIVLGDLTIPEGEIDLYDLFVEAQNKEVITEEEFTLLTNEFNNHMSLG